MEGRSMSAKVGQPLVPAQPLCPLSIVQHLANTVHDKTLRDAIASTFFSKGKFWMRDWHVYYLYVPDGDGQTVLLLVPVTQVEQFIRLVNEAFPPGLSLGDDAEAAGRVLDFRGVHSFTARFLGRPHSQTDMSILRRYIPPASYAPAREYREKVQECSGEYQVWTEKLQTSLRLAAAQILAAKNLGKAEKARVQKEKAEQRKAQLLRAERYLGMRGASDSDLPVPVDVRDVVPYGVATSIVFICIDTESHEFTHRLTEIGLSILDSADVFDMPPGPFGQNWSRQIHTRHIRIQEHLRHSNHRFLQGCPESFNFGKSEIFPARLAYAGVNDVFTRALAHDPVRYGGRTLPVGQQRNCVLVGHALKGDIDILKTIGYDVYGRLGDTIVDTIDTAMIHQALHHATQATSLVKVLAEFNIEAHNLHNAGNDAAYTLRAMLAILVASASRRTDTPRVVQQK